MLYGGGPKPKSYLPAHNHVAHVIETHHGERGFRRFWIAPALVRRGDFVECPCGWRAPSWKRGRPHYALSIHVRYWRRLIRKHGSLEKAQAAERRKITRGLPVWGPIAQRRRKGATMKIVMAIGIAMLVAFGSIAARSEERATRYITVCCPDQQALDTAVAIARTGDRRSLAEHLRSFCSSDRPARCVTVTVE
jgi:hypothetical protein